MPNRQLLSIAAWMACAAGLLEGAVAWAIHRAGWWDPPVWAAPLPDMLWVAPVFYLGVFLAVAAVLLVGARIFPRLPVLRAGVFVFSFLIFTEWLGLTQRLAPYAVVVAGAGLAAVTSRAAGLRLLGLKPAAPLAVVVVVFAAVEGGGALRERRYEARLSPPLEGAPNVLLVIVDALRADRVSAYGYPRPTTPNLDRLARDGVLFENAVAASSWTLPSHRALLTGRPPREWTPEVRTLAEAFRDRGYRTAGFSANAFFFNRRVRGDRGFLHFEDYLPSPGGIAGRMLHGRAMDWALRRLGVVWLPWQRRASDINRALLGWLDRGRDRPFFPVLNYMEVHDWFLGSPALARRGSLENLTAAEGRAAADAYDSALQSADRSLGELLAELQRRDLHRTTLVAVTSDHGESNSRQGGHRRHHGILLFAVVGPAGTKLRLPLPRNEPPASCATEELRCLARGRESQAAAALLGSLSLAFEEAAEK